jgi:hypothetical protein
MTGQPTAAFFIRRERRSRGSLRQRQAAVSVGRGRRDDCPGKDKVSWWVIWSVHSAIIRGTRESENNSAFLASRQPGYNPAMMIVLPTLSVAFAAFCVWLTARIINRRERWAKRIAVILAVLLVAYPLSVRPAFWILERAGDPGWAIDAYHMFYAPIWWVYDHGPQPVRSLIWWYCRG